MRCDNLPLSWVNSPSAPSFSSQVFSREVAPVTDACPHLYSERLAPLGVYALQCQFCGRWTIPEREKKRTKKRTRVS